MQIQARHIETVACRTADTDLSLPDGNGRQLASLRGFIGRSLHRGAEVNPAQSVEVSKRVRNNLTTRPAVRGLTQ